MTSSKHTCDVAVIGAGPAGLSAAEHLAQVGYSVEIFERMPTPARKFLMAGKSGLNITHNEELPGFLKKYRASTHHLREPIEAFGPKEIQAWARDLGTETFVGSSGRVFPKVFKASPLLRAWLRRLNDNGVKIHTRSAWTGWDEQSGFCQFNGPAGDFSVNSRATILALGGVSWPKLGSAGEWQERMQSKEITMVPFTPSNCGFNVNWSPHFRIRFAGHPLKNCVIRHENTKEKGDVMITESGIEGGAVYKLSSSMVQALALKEDITLSLDLTPDRSVTQLEQRLSEPQGKRSLTDHIRRKAGLKGVQLGLLREVAGPNDLADPETSANLIKKLPLTIKSPRPIEEAISVAGGIAFEMLDENLMLKALPGTFCAGEMVAWNAPTGGYLLTACLAQGRQAAEGVHAWLGRGEPSPKQTIRITENVR